MPKLLLLLNMYSLERVVLHPQIILTLTVCITAVNTDPTELDSSLLLLFVEQNHFQGWSGESEIAMNVV